MADFELKENTGVLFKNKFKEKDTHADYTGTVNINGKLYYESAWINESKAGEKYFRRSFRPVEDAPAPEKKSGPMDGLKDDLPF